MAKATFDIKTEATRPLYAGVGVTDRAVELVRDYVADVQQRLVDVQTSVRTLDLEPKALRDQALTAVNARVDALSKQARARRAAIEARVADLQSEALAYPVKVQETATATYGDLVARGEKLVDRIRNQRSTQQTAASAKTATAKAKTTRTQTAKATKSTAKKTASTARKAAASTTSAPKSSAKATATAAKATASSAADAASDAAAKVGD